MNKIRPLTLDSLNENIFSRIKNRVSGMFRRPTPTPTRTPFVPTPPSASQRKALTSIARSNINQQKGSEALNPRYAALSNTHKEKLGDMFRSNLADMDHRDYKNKVPGATRTVMGGDAGPSYRRLKGIGAGSKQIAHQERRRRVKGQGFGDTESMRQSDEIIDRLYGNR